jgi:hypothetical protein
MKACHHLDRYLDNRLPSDERQRFESHLASCGLCREETAIWNKIASEIGAIGREQIDAQPMTPLSEQGAVLNPDLNRRQSAAAANHIKWLAAAAVLIGLSLLFWFVGNNENREEDADSAAPRFFSALSFVDDTIPKKQNVSIDSLIRTREGERILIDLGNDTVGLKTGSVISIEKADRQNKVLRLKAGTLACAVAPKSHGGSFVVVAGHYRVRVVGTAFSVTLEDDSGLTVAVKKGTVDVTGFENDLVKRVTAGNDVRVGPGTTPIVSRLSSEKNAEIDAMLRPVANATLGDDTGDIDTHLDEDRDGRVSRRQKSKKARSAKRGLGASRDKQSAEESPVRTWQRWVLSGRIDDAEKALEAYVRGAPNDAEAWFLLADCRKRKKAYSEAVSIYKRAIPNLSERAADTARYRAAVILQDNLGAHKKAIDLLEQFLEHADRAHHLRAEAMLRLGLSLRSTGQTARANTLFRQIVENHGATASAVRAKKLLE